jgi:predicted dehydrogenase
MTERRLGIILNGATGRLAQHQHLRALMTLRREGGLPLKDGTRLVPDPILVGRSEPKLSAIAEANGGLRWTTDFDAALADKGNEIFFDAAATGGRRARVKRAIAAGKHIYVEKPVATSLEGAMELVRSAEAAGLKNGVVQDKLFLPGLKKLRAVRDSGFFGRVLSARLEFGWWVFDGETQPGQRSSWNYKRAEGGGLVLDMYAHWRYIIDRLVGEVRAVSCTLRTDQPRRRDEQGRPYDVDVEDAAYAHFELEGGVMAVVTSSWATRVKRDDLLTLQVDGTGGSAVATLHDCWTQAAAETPKPIFSPDVRLDVDHDRSWAAVPEAAPFVNSFRSGWELYLRHVFEDGPFPSPLLEGAKAVQLADAAYRSHAERRWIDIPPLTA